MKPRWMKSHVSCPNCGHIYQTADELAQHTKSENRKEYGTGKILSNVPVAVDCPNCFDYRTYHDFWMEQEFKWGQETEVE